MQDTTGDEPPTIRRAANVAGYLAVGSQTININGHPQWIAAVPVEQLQRAVDHLRKARQHHDNRAVAIAGSVLVLWYVLILVLAKLFYRPTTGDSYAWLALVIVAGAVPAAVWFASYSNFRLHRLTMHVIERRLAEIQTEIVIRESNQASPDNVLMAVGTLSWKHWWERVRKWWPVKDRTDTSSD